MDNVELQVKALNVYKISLENQIRLLGETQLTNYTLGNYQLKHLIKDMQEYTHAQIKLIEVENALSSLTAKEVIQKGCSHD